MTPHPADDFLPRALVVPPDMDTARRRARLWLGAVCAALGFLMAGVWIGHGISEAPRSQEAQQ